MKIEWVNRLKNMNILVYGMGISGIAATNLLFQIGSQITICDKQDKRDILASNKEWRENGIIYFSEEKSCEEMKKFDLVIVGPGIRRDSMVINSAKKNKVKIWSEIELAFNLCEGKIIAITGTNGKSTTTTLISELLNKTGINNFILGNIGKPFSASIQDICQNDLVVLEVSAGQLEYIENFKPQYAVILNIRPEHINIYKNFGYYRNLKKNITKNQDENDFLLLNLDDSYVLDISKGSKAKKYYFSKTRIVNCDAYIGKKQLHIIQNVMNSKVSIDTVFSIEKIRNYHIDSFLVVSILWGMLRIPKDCLITLIESFQGLEHAIEYVGDKDGVSYFNDSKATNSWSTLHAIECLEKPIVLITGGKDDKEEDFLEVVQSFKRKVVFVFVIGETSLKIMEACKKSGYMNIKHASNLNEAISESMKIVQSNQCVLFSPGANSKDMFINHKERGKEFKRIIKDFGVKSYG